MPTYDYICRTCGHTFSAFQRMSDPALTSCPADGCGEEGRVERLLGGGAGLIFKGSGFYITDYRNAGNPAGAGGARGEARPAAEPAAGATPAAAAAKGDSAGAPSPSAPTPTPAAPAASGDAASPKPKA